MKRLEERIYELKDISIEIIHLEEQREKIEKLTVSRA